MIHILQEMFIPHPSSFLFPMLLHITPAAQWQQAQQDGAYRAESLATEGFIHCSTIAQIDWVVDKFYKGQTNLRLLYIDPDKVEPEIRYEEVVGVPVENHFPHIYGALNLDAVVRVVEFEPGDRVQMEPLNS